MNKTKNNFNAVAWCYDFLSSMVFGNKIRKSQIVLFNEIKNNDHILIIGGGTGWIINELLKVKKVAIIDYVEASKAMLHKAKSNTRLYNDITVNFIHGDENDIGEKEKYDSILACYFFDQFQFKRLELIISKLTNSLKSDGKLLVADFNLTASSSLKHKIVVKIMYLFFYITCRLETRQLIQFQPMLENHNLILENSFSSFNGLMLSQVYRKIA